MRKNSYKKGDIIFLDKSPVTSDLPFLVICRVIKEFNIQYVHTLHRHIEPLKVIKSGKLTEKQTMNALKSFDWILPNRWFDNDHHDLGIYKTKLAQLRYPGLSEAIDRIR